MKPSHRIALGGMVTVLSVATPAFGARQPAHLKHSGLELASGGPARSLRMARWQAAPARARAAWLDLLQHTTAGSSAAWGVASWDPATKVPSRIALGPVSAPGASGSAAIAESVARAVLERHLDLLAPGAGPGDWVLAVDHAERGLRTVVFHQLHRGLPVLGGQVSFRFKADRLFVVGSEALPDVTVRLPASTINAAAARDGAAAWIRADVSGDAVASEVDQPAILPLIRSDRVLGYAVVRRVEVQTQHPISRWDVYVDAESGQPVARRQTLRFAEGTVYYNAPQRYAESTRLDYPAAEANLIVDGAWTTTDLAGLVSFADGPAVPVTTSAQGPHVFVQNLAGPAAAADFSLDPGGSITWNEAGDEFVDAQLSAFVHASIAKAKARQLAPAMSWLDQQLGVRVNHDDVCNAFWDGATLNFLRAGGPCANTGLVADVIYHEFGHGLHQHALAYGSGQYEAALGEGVADFFSANITGDPGMGRGFFAGNDQPLRQIDPADGERIWPYHVSGSPHYTGLIIGGALWDMRKELVAKYGEEQGVSTTEQLYYQAITNAVDIPSMYIEVLAADDDDGDLQNGTPNGCEIGRAFGAHGLRAMVVEADTPDVVSHNLSGYTVRVETNELIPACGGELMAGVTLQWRLRRTPRDLHEIEMSGGSKHWEGTIPHQRHGQVVQYRLIVRLSDSGVVERPANPADPFYEFYVGDVEPIYCTDFEGVDPFEEGWTHELASGQDQLGADDWQWDEPRGTGTNGDPPEAYSGLKVIGNDLSPEADWNGWYQPDRVNFALSPVIDTSGHEVVRLQYRRWLNVEDGHFDQATIYGNDEPLWTNYDSRNGDEDSNTHHADREWRFHDVDLSEVAADGSVQLKFEIASDGGLEMGGWTIDDFCVVGMAAPAEHLPNCGNGVLDDGEECDDGNARDGDGCDGHCFVEPEPVAAAVPDYHLTGGCDCRQAAPLREGGVPWQAVLVVAGLGLASGRRRRGQLP